MIMTVTMTEKQDTFPLLQYQTFSSKLFKFDLALKHKKLFYLELVDTNSNFTSIQFKAGFDKGCDSAIIIATNPNTNNIAKKLNFSHYKSLNWSDYKDSRTGMVIRVVEFSSWGYKIGKIFCLRINLSKRNY
jgi:hypothetical protein